MRSSLIAALAVLIIAMGTVYGAASVATHIAERTATQAFQ